MLGDRDGSRWENVNRSDPFIAEGWFFLLLQLAMTWKNHSYE